ncbi:NAD(P)-binding protein [Balneolales bacterium ANBcel1]|nr:NAD(P)-binding protein [Balneolales bacterium ANBcel1]
MKIGIIGAGIAGLTAGRILAKAGHEITVYEKSRGVGGRMSTRRSNADPVQVMDHGAPFLSAEGEAFRAFVSELEQKGIVREWTETFSSFAGGNLLPEAPGTDPIMRYVAPAGMNSIGKYLGRWMDFYLGEKIGGLTYIGGSGVKKRPWMINSSTINVFESDAVIIATPAVQAYGLVSTAQDELDLRTMITVLDDITYSSAFSFMAQYGRRDLPEWKAIVCEHPAVSWICNEAGKRDTSGELTLVAHTTDAFTKSRIDEYKQDPAGIDQQILKSLGEILGNWAARPGKYASHLWRYVSPKKSLDMPFIESEDEQAPLALTGDYFQGTSMEAAYLSGMRLGEHWAEKFS